MFRNVSSAVSYAIHKKLLIPRRKREWNLKDRAFVHTTSFGQKFELHPGEEIDKDIFVEGMYELRILRVIERVFSRRPGSIMVDVGANIGNHAIYLSRYFDRIICFEPSPEIAARLKSNIKLNGITNIQVENVGLSNRDAMMHFKLNKSGNLGASGFQAEANAETIDLPVRKGDDCLSHVDRLDLLKVDVEEHELQVFQGLQKSISKYRPIISFEFQGHVQGVDGFNAIRKALEDYIFVDIDFAPWSASQIQKLVWQVKRRGCPEFKRIDKPQPRFYSTILAFPDDGAFENFASAFNSPLSLYGERT